MNRPACVLILLSLLLTACGGGGDPTELTNEGSAALASGNGAEAARCFQQALKELEPGDPLYKRARLGEIEAKMLANPEAAKASFLTYAKEHPEQLEARDYHAIGTKFSDRKALKHAVDVLGAGKERFPSDAKLDEALTLMVAAAEKTGDTSALDALAGLGYAGSGK